VPVRCNKDEEKDADLETDHITIVARVSILFTPIVPSFRGGFAISMAVRDISSVSALVELGNKAETPLIIGREADCMRTQA
jgi:hypothetical protein